MDQSDVKTLLMAIALTAVALPAMAHHSGAMFDDKKEVTLTGTVKEFQYTNPHSWLLVDVMGADGKTTPDSREGWRSSGVPGSVAGLWEAWHTLGSGKQTWAELIAPAIRLAEEGFVVDEAFRKAIEIVQPGTTTDQIARLWPEATDFGFASEMAAFGLQFGHGLGLGLHERPIISRLNSLDHPIELREGMVFALETYCPATDGQSAARIEEEVVVTSSGCSVLTLFPAEELFVTNKY